MHLKGQRLHGIFLPRCIPEVIRSHVQPSRQVQCFAFTDDHLPEPLAHVHHGRPPMIGINTGHQVTQSQLGDINGNQRQIACLDQCNQLTNERLSGGNHVNQVPAATGSIFRKRKYIADCIGRIEIENVLEFPLQGITKLRVFNALRALQLEHLVLIHR